MAEIDNLTLYQILNITKLEAFAEQKVNGAQMMVSVFDQIENIGKGGY